jgi:hypothetical protein
MMAPVFEKRVVHTVVFSGQGPRRRPGDIERRLDRNRSCQVDLAGVRQTARLDECRRAEAAVADVNGTAVAERPDHRQPAATTDIVDLDRAAVREIRSGVIVVGQRSADRQSAAVFAGRAVDAARRRPRWLRHRRRPGRCLCSNLSPSSSCRWPMYSNLQRPNAGLSRATLASRQRKLCRRCPGEVLQPEKEQTLNLRWLGLATLSRVVSDRAGLMCGRTRSCPGAAVCDEPRQRRMLVQP